MMKVISLSMLLDGKSLSIVIEEALKVRVNELKRGGIYPSLAVILVGDDFASASYVRMKSNACLRVGIKSEVFNFKDIKEQELLALIRRLNDDEAVSGILVQLPLPDHINTALILESIKASKDVDGFNPYNIGCLSANLECFSPATPLGVMRMLEEYKIGVKGQNVCIVGASNIVGKPLFHLMLNAGASVCITHEFTKNLGEWTRMADILCVAVGKPKLITEDMVKDGAVVIDIGTNRVDGKLCGDVDFLTVSNKTSYITPVPGGVGPMTISALLENTLKAAELGRVRKSSDL